VEGLKRKLKNKLGVEDESLQVDFEVAEVLGTYWRTNFEPLQYPYLPPHVTRPKEQTKVYLVLLPEAGHMQVRNGFVLRAVALMHLHENPVQFGPLLSGLPHLLSRLRFNLIAAEEDRDGAPRK